MTIKPMTLEEAVEKFCAPYFSAEPTSATEVTFRERTRMATANILRSYALHVIETARPKESNDSCNDYKDGMNKAIADYHSAAMALINKE